MHKYIHTNIHTYIRTYVSTYAHTYVGMYMHAYVVLGDTTIFVNIMIGEIFNIFILPFQS